MANNCFSADSALSAPRPLSKRYVTRAKMIKQFIILLILSTFSLAGFAKTEKEAFEIWQGYIDSGNRAMRNKNYEEAERLFSLAFKEIKEFGFTPALAGTYSNLGMASSATGKLQKAEQFYKNAVAISQKTRGNFHRETAMDLQNLSSIELQLDKIPLAEEHISVALRIMTELGLKQDPATQAMIDLWAQILDKKGDKDAAQKMRGLLEKLEPGN
jgi:tetratricopeptide (TPR) repeat protein